MLLCVVHVLEQRKSSRAGFPKSIGSAINLGLQCFWETQSWSLSV